MPVYAIQNLRRKPAAGASAEVEGYTGVRFMESRHAQLAGAIVEHVLVQPEILVLLKGGPMEFFWSLPRAWHCEGNSTGDQSFSHAVPGTQSAVSL
jgi:hypothetical protein